MSQAVKEGTAAARLPASHPPEIDTPSILKLGLGGFASPVGVLCLAVCAMLVWHGIQRMDYALQSEPLVLGTSELARAGHNDYVRVTGQLERDRQTVLTAPGGEPFTLTPLAGAGGGLLVYRRESAGAAPGTAPETITGRIVGRDWSGHWDLSGRSVDVARELASRDVPVPQSAVVLIADEIPQFELWPAAIGTVGAMVWLWFGVRVIHTGRLLASRERVAAELQRHLDESDDDELQSLRVHHVAGRLGSHRGG